MVDVRWADLLDHVDGDLLDDNDDEEDIADVVAQNDARKDDEAVSGSTRTANQSSSTEAVSIYSMRIEKEKEWLDDVGLDNLTSKHRKGVIITSEEIAKHAVGMTHEQVI